MPQIETHWKQAATAGEALKEIREHSENDAHLGLEFERLFSMLAPYVAELDVKHIYRLSEWPDARKYGLDGKDIGADRVAILASGEVVAIQCKCFREDHKVQKSDVASFLAGTQNKVFDLRWLVTTSDLTSTVRQMLANTNIKHLDFHKFGAYSLKPLRQQPARKPFPLQQEAINEVLEGFTHKDRGQLIMACGTGKTFVSLKIAEQIVRSGGRVLFIAPSIALVAQARKEWLEHTSRPLGCTVVCSDSTVGNGSVSLHEFSFSVTTDPKRIAHSLADRRDGATSAVFCTYHSLPKVIEAQKKYKIPSFDLALVDEAHRTTGVTQGDDKRLFQRIHDQKDIQCEKRLYMTATPRIYNERAKASRQAKDPDITITDMNDTAVYGERFYRLTFRKAVDADMLCDVRVICLGLSEDMLDGAAKTELESISNQIAGSGAPPGVQEYMSALVISLAINGWIEGRKIEIPEKLPRTLAYAKTVRRSKWLSEVLESRAIQGFLERYRQSKSVHETKAAMRGIEIKAYHLDAQSSAYERHQKINELNATFADQTAKVISNCRLFSEGVDIPALDSVAFLDPKSSTTDIIQSIGRVMRKGGKEKKLGYIIAPVAVPPGKSMAEALEDRSPRFEVLGKVLRALQAHDETLYDNLPGMVLVDDGGGGGGENGNEGEHGNGGEHEEDTLNSDQQLLLGIASTEAVYALLAKYSGLGNRGKIIADIIIDAVKRAAKIFHEEKLASPLTELMGATPELLASLNKKEKDSKLNEATHTAALIICNACLMHKRLEKTGNLGKLHPLEKMGSKKDAIALLLDDWRAILKQDYKPIFDRALYILTHLKEKHSHKAQLQVAIKTLINCAVDTSESLNELGYDHAGPLFHKILDNAASQGAFYTKNLSALLMAQLVFHDKMLDWSNKKKVRGLRIIDPCCGTGTLLLAGLDTIKKKAINAQQPEDKAVNAQKSNDEVAEAKKLKDASALHKSLVEKSIYGLDITSQAIQLAACNLTLGAPNTSYDKMNMHALEYGMAYGKSNPTPGTVRQGALELFNYMGSSQIDYSDQAKQITLEVKEHVPLLATGVVDQTHTELEIPANFNVVMMNPPFTDTSKQKTQFPTSVGKAMSQRLQRISERLKRRSPDSYRALARMSIEPFFTPLANRLITPKEGGTLAKFIPCTALTSNNGLNKRRYLAKHFHIEIVITSHDPKSVAFSASTSIHESLLIARRKKDKSAPTRFIQLAHMPTDSIEVKALSDAILSSGLGVEGWGNCINWPADKVQEGDWSPVQWYSGELLEAIEHIKTLEGLEVSKDNYQWSPGGREFRGCFDYDQTEDVKKANAYCSIAVASHQTMASPPDSWSKPKPKREKQAKDLRARGGHVLVPCRVRVTNAKVLTIYSETPAIGSAFRPIDNKEKIPPDTAKAYAVFLNSTFGALQFLNRRASKLDYPSFETGHMETLLLPSAKTLNLKPLVDVFNKTQKEQLLGLSEADKDPIRRKLDHAVAKLLGVDTALTDKWRALLVKEPIISGKPATNKPAIGKPTTPPPKPPSP